MLQGNFFGAEFDKYLYDTKSPFKGLDLSKATTNLLTQMPKILGTSLMEWEPYLAPKSASQLKAFLIYLPNPALLPEIEIPTPGCMKIGRTPISFIAGGTSNFGRLIGMGVKMTGTPTSGKLQIWRMDYHPWHHTAPVISDKNDVKAWDEGDFHYHVRRRPPL
jgi:hypothetical protein